MHARAPEIDDGKAGRWRRRPRSTDRVEVASATARILERMAGRMDHPKPATARLAAESVHVLTDGRCRTARHGAASAHPEMVRAAAPPDWSERSGGFAASQRMAIDRQKRTVREEADRREAAKHPAVARCDAGDGR